MDILACLKGGNFTYKSYTSGAVTGPITTATLKTKTTGGCSIAGAAIVNKVSTIVDANGVITFENSAVLNGDITVTGD